MLSGFCCQRLTFLRVNEALDQERHLFIDLTPRSEIETGAASSIQEVLTIVWTAFRPMTGKGTTYFRTGECHFLALK